MPALVQRIFNGSIAFLGHCNDGGRDCSLLFRLALPSIMRDLPVVVPCWNRIVEVKIVLNICWNKITNFYTGVTIKDVGDNEYVPEPWDSKD